MHDSVIIFSDKIDDIIFAREKSGRTVRFASNFSVLTRIVEKFGAKNLFVAKNCLSETFLSFAEAKSLIYFRYDGLNELDLLLSKEIPPEIYEDKNLSNKSPLENEDESLCKLSPAFALLVGSSPAIRTLRREIARVALFDVSVLLTGETGTGKTTVARAIHELSSRREKAFKDAVLSNSNESLIEAKLFGVSDGAFTGAVASRGLFEEADGGTLFLDEIGEISLNIQTKLLQVLSEGVINRIGSNKDIRVDNRMIFATNANLEKKLLEKTFRDDLYYRINDVSLKVPPLRERIEDIPDLCRAILKREKLNKEISDSAIKTLQTVNWKGNIRQLEKCVRNAALLYSNGEVIEACDIRI